MTATDRIRELLARPTVRDYFEGKSVFAIFLALVSGAVAVVGVVAKVLSWDASLAALLSKAVVLNGADKKPELKLWFVPLPLVLVAGAAAFALLVIWNILQRYSQSKDQLALQQFMSAVRQIRDQGKQTTIKAWDSLTFIYLIGKDYSGTLTRNSVLKAVDAAVHFCEIVHEVEDEADGAESLAAVHYVVYDPASPGSNVAYLPSENNLRSKKACVFFLPPIPVGESREFKIGYRWPGMFKRLKRNSEDIAFSSTTKDVLTRFRLEVYLEEGCGKRLECSITGNVYPGQTLEQAKYRLNDWSGYGYIYEVSNIPPGDIRLVLRTELKG